jgi:hypothetical protein
MNGTFTARGQRSLVINIPYRGSKGPLHLLNSSRQIALQSPAEQWTAPTILDNVTTRSPIVTPTQSSHRARIPTVTAGAVARKEALRASKYLGRTL